MKNKKSPQPTLSFLLSPPSFQGKNGAAPGTEARVVVRSDQIAADVNVYFYDDYFDFIPLTRPQPRIVGKIDRQQQMIAAGLHMGVLF